MTKRMILWLTVHAVVAAALLALMLFVFPVFLNMYKDFGARLPGPTQFVANFSFFVRRYGFFLGAPAMILFCADAAIGGFLDARVGRRASNAWWGAVLALLLAALLLSAAAFWLPLMTMSNPVEL